MPKYTAKNRIRPDQPRIWSIWLQGEENAPAIVKSCFASIRKYYPDRLTVLDDSNLFDYITLPEPIFDKYRKGMIRHCHFTDICRVELLQEYGGYWMDATCFMTAPIPEQIANEDFFVYRAGNINDFTLIQNCFITADRDSYLLGRWRDMILDYWTHCDSAIHYFIHQMMFRYLIENNGKATEKFNLMPQICQDPTHLLWYSYADQPFDLNIINDLTRKGYFFQKTSWNGTSKPLPGSFRNWILDYAQNT